MTVAQVKFNYCGQPGATEEYWSHIGACAAFIGARLQHRKPLCNSRNPRCSTIHVEQYKEKFGDVRVYCTLADDEEVRAKWEEEGNGGDPTPEFRAKCLARDAYFYRRVYLDMVSLVPQYHNAILLAADHEELLQDDEFSIDAYVTALKPEWLAWKMKKYGALDAGDLKAKLRLIYEGRSWGLLATVTTI